VELTGAGVAIEGSPRRVERAWLERIRQDASLGWAIAWPSDPKACDRLFRVWDAVEKSDPKRAGAAAIRTRLDLTLAAIGMRPERDLWPRLRGISGWIATDPVGRPRRVVLSLHMVDEPAADRILEPLGRWSFPGLGVGEEPAVTDRSRIHVQREGATIDLIWGSSEVTRAPTGTSTPREEATLATMLVDQEPLPERFVWLRPRTWVAESLGVISAGALGTSDIIWTGYQEGDRSIERIRWREVDGVLKRTLEPPGGGAEDAAAVPVSR
jgi:hypothetical protein